MPVIIPVFQHPPDRLVLLATANSLGSAQHIARALSMCTTTSRIETNIYTQALPPYDPDQAERICNDALQAHAGENVSVNITAGTKIMSAAALVCAIRTGAEAVYAVSDGQGRIIRWQGNGLASEPIRVSIPIGVRFACHGLTAAPGPVWNEQLLDAARILGALAAECPNQQLIRRFASLPGSETSSITVQRSLTGEQKAVTRLVSLGVIRAHGVYGGGLAITLPSDPVQREFVCGKWLEAYMYRTCREADKFQWVWPNVIVSDAAGVVVNELDLVVARNEEMAICSCKVGGRTMQDLGRGAIYELESVAGPLRAGRYCRKALVTARRDLPRPLLERARQADVRVLTAADLSQAADIISGLLES